MAYHYGNPSQADSPYTLPNVEVFEAQYFECPDCSLIVLEHECPDCGPFSKTSGNTLMGWFYWFCLPGCLPDSEPFGPFATEAEALQDAQENAGDNDDEE